MWTGLPVFMEMWWILHVDWIACVHGNVVETACELGCQYMVCTAHELVYRHVEKTADELTLENVIKKCMCPGLGYLHWVVQ